MKGTWDERGMWQIRLLHVFLSCGMPYMCDAHASHSSLALLNITDPALVTALNESIIEHENGM